MGTPLTPLDFKFNFFPWYRCPDYAIDPKGVVIEDAYARYFEKLRTRQVSNSRPRNRPGTSENPTCSSRT